MVLDRISRRQPERYLYMYLVRAIVGQSVASEEEWSVWSESGRSKVQKTLMRKGLIKTDSVFPNTFPSNESFCLRASSISRTQKSEPRGHAFIVKIPSVAGVRRFLPKIAEPRTQRFGSKGFGPGSDEIRT